METVKLELVTITEYAQHYNISRPTVYDLMDREVVKVYEIDGEKKLNKNERPVGVKRYGDTRKKRIS